MGSALLLAACAGQPEEAMAPTAVSAISVSTDLQSIGNAESVRYWQTLNSDLEAALVTQFVDRIDPSGAVISVDVDEIALANAYSSRFQDEDSRLAGRVVLSDPFTGEVTQTYDVTASTREAASLLSGTAGVVTISPDSDEFYAALVQAFARGVEQAVLQGS
jgi:hypothetical protein